MIEYIFTYNIVNEKVYAQEISKSKLFELFSHMVSMTHLCVLTLTYLHAPLYADTSSYQ